MLVLNFLNILTFLVLLVFLILAFNRIAKGNAKLVNFAIILLFLFNVLPLILDVIVGKPEYSKYWVGYIKSIDHMPSSILYNFYIIFTGILLNIYASSKNTNSQKKICKSSETNPYKNKDLFIDLGLFFIILLPVLHILTSPFLINYATYGSPGMRGIFDSEFNVLNNMLRVNSLAFLSIWILRRKIEKFSYKIFIFFTFFSLILIWIDGKRNMFAFIMVILFYYLWVAGLLKGKKLLTGTIIGMTLLIGASIFYQTSMRSDIVDYGEFEQGYKDYRVNFGRDAVVKFALYSEMEENSAQILDYRGQTFLSTALMYVPRGMWEDKPFQYTRYITSAILAIDVYDVTWGITYSILDQTVANFGMFIGIPLAPIIIILISRVGDRSIKHSIKLLTLLVICGFMTMGIAYIGPIIVMLVLMKIHERINYEFAIKM